MNGLDNVNWIELNDMNMEDAFDKCPEIIEREKKNQIDICAPVKTFQISYKHIIINPCITPEFLKSART